MTPREAPDGCAAAVVRLAADAGIALTLAERDCTLMVMTRVTARSGWLPTFSSLADLEQAMRGLVTRVRLAADGYRPRA